MCHSSWFCYSFFLMTALGVHDLVAGLWALIIAFFLKRQIKKQYSDWVKPDDILGNVMVSEKNITLRTANHTQTLPLTNIRSIKLIYSSTKEWMGAYHANSLAAFYISDYQNQEQVIKFFYEKRKNLERLIPVLKIWYREGVNLNETNKFMGQDSVLLECYKYNHELREIISRNELGAAEDSAKVG